MSGVVVLVVALLAALAGGVVAAAATRRRVARRLQALLARPDEPVAVGLDAQLGVVERLAARVEAQTRSAATAEQLLRDVLEAIPAAVVLFDPGRPERLANEAGQRLLVGRHSDALVMDALREVVAGVRPEGTDPVTRQLEVVGPPRRTFSLLVRRLPTGEVLGIVDDISERRRLEEVRRDFVANISHELKTPIGALALLAETMSAEDEPELLVRLSQRVHREALRVASTIDDLLMLSRIEAGDEATVETVDLSAVVAEAVARISPAADARAIEITRQLVEPAATTMGDRRQLASAVYNLLENAVKYSDEHSSVVVRTDVEPDGGAIVEVTDRGIGIPARDIERIFERFYRVDRARSRLTGGTGLGLAIVRHVAQNHGGTVDVRSREGEGSAFTLRLPGQRRDSLGGPAPSPLPPPAQTRR